MVYNSKYISGNLYTTPEDTPHSIVDKITFKTRWYLFVKLALKISRYRKYALAGKYDDEMWINSSWEAIELIESVGGRFNISGVEHLKNQKEPVVIVANHMSTLETIVFPGIIASFRNVTFVIKDSIINMPLFGDIMKTRNPIVVGRKNPREDLKTVLNSGISALTGQDTSVLLFPQSTRSEKFDPSSFNSLGIKLAAKAGVKVIPCALKTDFWSNGWPIKEFGKLHREKTIYFEFGEPIDPIEKNSHKKTIDFIASSLEKWE